MFVPSNTPPHRPDSPRASGYHRLQMAAAGRGRHAWLVGVGSRAGPGRSVVSRSTRYPPCAALEPASQFFFITGADAFAEVATWRRYPEVLDLAHFVVIARTGHVVRRASGRVCPSSPRRFIECDRTSPTTCLGAAFPSIFLVHAVDPAGVVHRDPRASGSRRAARRPRARRLSNAISANTISMSDARDSSPSSDSDPGDRIA